MHFIYHGINNKRPSWLHDIVSANCMDFVILPLAVLAVFKTGCSEGLKSKAHNDALSEKNPFKQYAFLRRNPDFKISIFEK